jgi:sirohydrochlorin ferrochelatase
MIGYLLFSHGSLLCGAGQSLDWHAERLAKLLAPSPVEIGYLNYSEPDVETGIGRLIDRGAKKITVIPYFLVPGYFVTTSLPKCLEHVSLRYPDIKIGVADSLGVDSRIADAVLEMSFAARTPMIESQDVLGVAAASCRNRADCPLYNGPHCPKGAAGKAAPSERLTNSAPQTTSELGKKALLVMIHGSPKEEANGPMFAILDIVRAQGIFDFVQAGFMECNSPDIPNAIDLCVESGAAQIIAVPYFLHLGTHVAEDLPNLLIAGQVKHPSVTILMSDYLGRSPLITEVLRDRALASVS